jgi:hypothetical protein
MDDERVIEALNKNRIFVKQGQLSKWYDSDNPTLQIALYRLLSDEEELDKLTQNKVKHDGEISQKHSGCVNLNSDLFERIKEKEHVFRELEQEHAEGDLPGNDS